MDELREKIDNIENQLDDFNAKYGTSGNLCLFCHSKTYGGKQGIIHLPDCLILSLRSILALIPDEEDELRVVGLIKKQERERIIKDIHNIEFECDNALDFLNKTIYYLKTKGNQ